MEHLIDFNYFVLLSSNEMFIKGGLKDFIHTHKNGVQLVKFDKNNNWHLFHRHVENNLHIKQMLQFINMETLYGGQAEGQFYETHVFNIIVRIYHMFFNSYTWFENGFENEEIIPQTIFKSLGINHVRPITLQNYCNPIEFTPKTIQNIINNDILIPDHGLRPGTLTCPHVNNSCLNIYSIKRVERKFNGLRLYINNLI